MEWGPEINHGGKRLLGLDDDCPVDGKMIGLDPQWRHTRDGSCRADCLTWSAYDAVRLPADHPYYAIKAGDWVTPNDEDEAESYWPGKKYQVIEVEGDKIWFRDDDGDSRCRKAREFTKVDAPQPPTATEDSGPFVTVRMMTADEAYKRFYGIWHDTPKSAGEAATELLRELGLIREETTLDRYFANKAMTQGERDAVTAYAAWVENQK